MEQPQETGNDALWTEVAEATFVRAEKNISQQPAEVYVIRHKRFQEYFSYGHWTFNASDAQAFRSDVVAMSVAQQCGLSNVEVVSQSMAKAMAT